MEETLLRRSRPLNVSMTPKRRLLPFLALLLVWTNLNSSSAFNSLPSPSSSSSESSASTYKFSSRTPAPSGVIIDEAGARRSSTKQTEVRKKVRPHEVLGSPVNLFMPDEFQFYTLNANGQLVMKQMTKQEIQGMIAAGGGSGGLPVDLGHHQTQLPSGEPKVSDVVQNVQKVLKDELNKPIQVPVSESSIPGSVNSQWTNMLPYILSGGSVDQQDIDQNTSIILPALDNDQTYVDVVPLNGNKPSDMETNYISVPSTLNEEQEIKLITTKPSMSHTNGKPISLLGNMALDSGILGGHEIYTLPSRNKPNRPSTTPSYYKHTTTKSSVVSNTKVTDSNLKNPSGSKPTLYIPLSVSPSLLADAQNQNNYSSSGNLDFHVTSEDISRPIQEKNQTKSTNSDTNKKTTAYVHLDGPGFTRLPMIQVPVIEADKISTSTQRTNENQTPMFEILPTISPGSMTSSSTTSSHPLKINMGPMGGFKKPEVAYKPSTLYRPQYEPTTKSTTPSVVYSSSNQPVYEVKQTTRSTVLPTYRPVYEPSTKSSTVNTDKSTYRPVYEPTTKASATNFISTTVYHPVYEGETKPSSIIFKPTTSFQVTRETSTSTSSKFKVTQHPSSTYYTTGKASTLPDTDVKTSTPSGMKMTKYPNAVHQTKDKDPVIEIVTKPSVQSGVFEVTKLSNDVQKSTVKNEEKTTEKIKIDDYVSLNDSAVINKSESSTVLDNINDDENTVLYPDSTLKYGTTIPDKNDVESETPTLLYYNTEKTFTTDAYVSDQQLLLKTESYVLNEDTSVRPTAAVQSQESKTEDSDYHTLIQDVTTKEPEAIFKQTDSTLGETIETIISNLKNDAVEDKKYIQINEKDATDASFDETTKQFIPFDESTTEYYTLNYDSSDMKDKNSASMLMNKVNDRETTVVPLKYITTDKDDEAGSTKIYDFPIDSIVNYLSDQLSEKKPEILINPNQGIYNKIQNENSPVLGFGEKKNTLQTNTIIDATENPIKSTIQYTTILSEKEKEVTPLYEKIETITENSVIEDKLAENTPSIKESEKVFMREDEVSTIKVIPVYDDDAVMYTLPSDVPSKTTFIVPSTSTSNAPLSSTNRLPENNTPSTVLPGLQEAFNNYVKEHYDSNMPTTNNYDETLELTTITSILSEDSLNHKKKLPSLPSTFLDYLTTKEPEQKISQKTQMTTVTAPNDQDAKISTTILSSTLKTNLEQIQESSTKNTILKENLFTEVPEQKTTIDLTLNNKDNIETPIIYLHLTSPKSDEQNTKEHISNSSLTRIKIKNPISEIDKIISEAPAYTNSPTTVIYTIPNSDNLMPNNIASGLIAGYPTYTQGKPMAEYITSTKIDESIKESTTDSLIQLRTEEEKEKKKIEKTTSAASINNNMNTLENAPIVTSNDPLSLNPLPNMDNSKNPSQTEGNDDQINSSFVPPLEKINDLINQLKNSPDDYVVGTTIVPSDNFETTSQESNIKSNASTVMFVNSSETSIEPQNSTYVMVPTLPVNYTSKPIQSSTKPFLPNTTPIILSKVEMTTQQVLKIEPQSTTRLTTKQVTTEKPHTTLIFRTTKGPIEKVQSTIDKSAGRINLEEEKIKLQQIKPTEPTKYTMKNKYQFSTRRPANDGHPSYTRKTTKPIKFTSPTTAASTSTASTTTAERTTTQATDDSKESTDKWTLIPQKGVAEQQLAESKKNTSSTKEASPPQSPQIVPLDHSSGAIGLDQSNKGLDKDVAEFLNMCNELSFKFWTSANNGLSSSRSVTMSPFGMISTLAMIFLGARGVTSIQMNDILKLDDVVTFNPHLVFQNITDTVTLARNRGIENAAFVRALFADRLKIRRIMPFYKEQAQQFYEGAVVDINFSSAGDILRRRTNLLIRKQTGGRIKDFVKTHTVPLRSPLTALSANVFQTSCDGPDVSSEGRDGEMYFAVSQTVKQRKLVPIPAAVWKANVSAGYEPSLDATAVALGDSRGPVTMIMILPGQQGVTAPGDNLEKLEGRLFGSSSDALEKLLKVIIPRRVEVQMPKFSQRSILNITSALKRMGFEPLFTKTADLKGINGAGHDLYLADMLQMDYFCTCGDENKSGNRHLSETYPGTPTRHSRLWDLVNNNNGVHDSVGNRESDNSSKTSECEDGNSDDSSDSENLNSDELNQQSRKLDFDRFNNSRQKKDKKRIRWFMPSGRRRCRNRRQATEPEKPRMKIDKPFLYLIRHNLTGLILHIGRFNPKSQS